MGAWEGWRYESDKYVYFYEKKMDSTADYVWEVIDKKTGKLLPFTIYDRLSWIDWEDGCSFHFRYIENELSHIERQSKKLVKLANDVLKDFIVGKCYNECELEVYTKDIIKNALDKYGGLDEYRIEYLKSIGIVKDKDDDTTTKDNGTKSLYEEFLEEVDDMIIAEEDFLETKEARESRQNRTHMYTEPPLSFKVNKGFVTRKIDD